MTVSNQTAQDINAEFHRAAMAQMLNLGNSQGSIQKAIASADAKTIAARDTLASGFRR